MAAKYQEYFTKMLEENKEEFARFAKLHDFYVSDSESWQDAYNREGKAIVEIIRVWERKLCQTSERGQYGKYSAGLSDKFWEEIRKRYSKIDYIGVT